jgi:uncharacterized protein (TIGR02391 family)
MATKEHPLSDSVLTQISKIMGDTTDGLTGPEISRELQKVAIIDINPSITKWKRLFNAFAEYQNRNQCSNAILNFCINYFQPANFVNGRENMFENQRTAFNNIVAFAGLEMGPNGRLRKVNKAETISEATARANSLKSELINRKAHIEIFKYCTAELLANDYFHAVEEAIKGLFERVREIANYYKDDGSQLIDFVFTEKSPMVIINNFQSKSDISEHKGFSALMKALYSMFRNPQAHSPKVKWNINETDTLDVLCMVSLCHRKLDNAQKIR